MAETIVFLNPFYPGVCFHAIPEYLVVLYFSSTFPVDLLCNFIYTALRDFNFGVQLGLN